MRKSHRVASAAAMVGVALIGALAVPTTASATALSGSLSCEVYSPGYFDCSLAITGGTPPYTTTWTKGGFAYFTSTSTYGAEGNCNISKGGFSVSASVRDASGHTWSHQTFLDCSLA